ncbi:uncharacterized protein LOC143032809 [Oratosquilla oratoria]|uniref:uncharacterized protein LOC143032809 n=1 Tax=Oratosquilla oratoria TaxID=337810 RepID=UPI003F76320E
MRLTVACALLSLVLVQLASAAPPNLNKANIEQAFKNPKQVEDMIKCFKTKICTPDQDYIRIRALAAMRNFGTCPETLCTPQEAEAMKVSMELLAAQNSLALGRLTLAMLGNPNP